MLSSNAIEIRSTVRGTRFARDPYIHPIETTSSVNAQSAEYALDTRLRMYLQATGGRAPLD